MNSNIVLVGLNYEYTKLIAKQLCQNLDMFYLDVNGLIKYNLPEKQIVISTVSAEYYEEQINKIALDTMNYENSVINLPYEIFIKKEISSVLCQNALCIYVQIDKIDLQKQDINKPEENKLTIPLIAFEELDLILKEKCNFFASGKNTDEHIADLIAKIKNLYE